MKQVIDEMIHVAQPGASIAIADETEKASRIFAIFVGKHNPIVPPVDLIPETLRGEKLDINRKGYGYLIAFRKPT